MFIGLLSVCTILSFGEFLLSYSKRPIKCVSLNNQPCQTRPAIVHINSNETIFYPFTISFNKGGGSCSTSDDPYARLCVENKVKCLG